MRGRRAVVERPGLQGFGWWCYFQKNRISIRLDRAVQRVERARRASSQAQDVVIVRGARVESGR